MGLSNFADWLGRQDVWYGRTVTCLVECIGRLFPSTISTPSPVNTLALTLLRNAEDIATTPETPPTSKKKGKKKSKKEKEKEKEREKQQQQLLQQQQQPQQQGAAALGQGSSGGLGSPPPMDMNMDNAIAELQRVMAFRRTAERATSTHKKPTPGQTPRGGNSASNITRSTRLSTLVNSVNLPNFTMRQELENFFREARNKMELRLFQCECWMENSSRSDFVVPFFQSAELGYVADTRAMEENYDEPSPDPASHAGITAASRYKNMILPVLFLQAQITDLFGNDRDGPSFPVKTFFSLIMSNVPSIADDRTRVANPCHDWLEVHYTEIDAVSALLRSVR